MIMVRVMSNLFCTLMSCCGDQDSLAPLDPVRSASATMANKERRGLSTADKGKSRQYIHREQVKIAKEQTQAGFQTKTNKRSYDKPLMAKPSLRKKINSAEPGSPGADSPKPETISETS